MPGLVDHLGRPVSTASLKKANEALSHTAGIRSVMTGHPADGLNPARLGAILKAAERGDAVQYLELAEAMEEKDSHYLSVMGTRKRAVSQLPITLKAAGDTAKDLEIAEFVEDWLERETLEAELFDVLDAVGKGFSVSALGWDTSEGQWLPDKISWIDPRWFEIDHIDGRTLYLRGEHGGREELTPFGYMIHEHQAKSGLPIRGGLARPVAWAWMFKTFTLKDWVSFAEVYGLPLRVGKYGPGATPAEIATLMHAVADIGGDAAAVIPESMKIEFVDGKAQTSADFFERLHDKMDQQISKAVLGQTATTDAIAGGHAVGREHNEVRGDIERADAKLLATTLNIQIIRPIVQLNFGPQRRYPKVQIGREEAVDLGIMAEVLAKLVPLGLDAEVSFIRDRLGIPEPKKGAPILRAATTPPETPRVGFGAPMALPSPGKPGATPPEPSQGVSGGEKVEEPPVPAAAATQTPADAIDRLIGDVVGDGEWIAGSVVDGLDEVMGEAGDLVVLRDHLAAAMAKIDVTQLQEILARSSFNARLAGAAGLNLTEETNA